MCSVFCNMKANLRYSEVFNVIFERLTFMEIARKGSRERWRKKSITVEFLRKIESEKESSNHLKASSSSEEMSTWINSFSCHSSRKKGESLGKFQIVFVFGCLIFLSCCGGNRINLLSRFFRFVLDIIEIFCKRGGKLMLTNFTDFQRQWRPKLWYSMQKKGASKSIFVRKSGEGKWGKSVVVVGYGNWLHLRDKYSKLCYDLNQNETASFMLWQSELFSSCGGDKERLDNEISRMMKSEVAQFFKAFNTRREKRKINEMKRYFAHF